MVIVFYISGHGFGHAARSLELLRAIAARDRRARFVVRTSVPQWFIERSAGCPVDVQPAQIDTGMVQRGSLQIDVDESARQAARFYASFEDRAQKEAQLLRSLGASIVIADIPPLALAAAARAGVPSIALGNFTWDWIYGYYPEFETLAPRVGRTMRDAYARASQALRLPFHGGFESMAAVTRDIPLVARRSQIGKAEARRLLQLPDDCPVAIASFGAYGVDLQLEAIARAAGVIILATEHELKRAACSAPPVVCVTTAQMERLKLRYQDLVAAADLVVSKPGYGIVSECIANGTALIYTSRDRFAEYDVFVREMPNYLRCRFISQEDLLRGRWREAIDDVLALGPAPMSLRIDGADLAAERVVELAETGGATRQG